ncbi:MAG: PilN domain-containing protein [Pyrinomonadaceae bacterium]
MIKVNLLNSVTDRQVSGAVVAVDRTMSSSTTRLLVMSAAVAFLLVAVVGWDVISSSRAKAKAEADLVAQQEIAKTLEAVMNEQKELEAKIAGVEARIAAIKKLRDEQKGPSAVLEALRERISMVPGLFLESVEQKGETLELKGNSPDEAQVTQFGRSLEFSNGLFANLNIETKREDVTNNAVAVQATASNPDAGKISVVKFTIKCAYAPAKGNAPQGTNPTNASTPAQPQAVQPQAAKQ